MAILFSGECRTALGDTDAACSSVTYECLLRSGVGVVRLEAAGLGPLFLYQRGARFAEDLLAFGYSSVHLAASDRVCNEALIAYGNASVRAAFVKCARDAVNLSGTPALTRIGLRSQDLVRACKDSPDMAIAVLLQMPKDRAFVGLSVTDLMQTGIKAADLVKHGFRSSTLSLQMGIRAPDLCRMGFSHPAILIS
jgi:hypothetical protein